MAEYDITLPSSTTSGNWKKPVPLFRKKSFSLESINNVELLAQCQTNISMEGLTLYNSLPSSDSTSSLRRLEKHMRQNSESMVHCRHCGGVLTEDEVSLLRSSSSQRFFGNSPTDLEGEMYRNDRKESDDLRRENNRMVLEVAYLKKENSAYLKQLKESHVIQERLKNQLDQLHKKLESRSSLLDIESFDCDSINSVVKEQLNAYREDFYEEKREREKYHTRNLELERNLEEAKRTLEMQQKKLLLYSQILTPIRTKLDLPAMTLSGKLKNVPGSTPTSPSYTSPKPFHMTEKKERKRTSVSVDLPRDHKSNSHILEATLLSGEKPRIKRSTTPPAYFREFSDDYLPDRIYEYDWNLSNEDVISK